MKSLEPIIIYKLPDGVNYKSLGRFAKRLNFFNKSYFIYIDIERIIKYCKDSKKLGRDITFDQIFSHVFSHEYIHFLLLTQVGDTENCAFDNLFGEIHINPKYVYSGVKFEGDYLYRLLKRHFYTKFINTITNKIRMAKK